MTVLAITAAATVGALCAVTTVRSPPRRVVEATPRASVRRRAPRRWLTLGLLGVIGLTIAGGPIVLVAATAFAVCTWVARRARRQRLTREAVASGLPHVMELMVITVKAGLSPLDAVRAVGDVVDGPIRDAFDRVVLRLERGHRLADALALLPELLGTGALSMADGIAAADRYGTPLAPVLDRLAVEAREARRRAAEARARTLPVRLAFPLVCCTLPSFVLMAIVPALLGTLSSLRGTGP